MPALNRKLLRDLLTMKGQSLAICLVMACGVATFVMSFTTLESLTASQEFYYQRYRFAQVFAQMTRAPLSLEAEIAQIPGVAQVQTRIVADVTLDVPEMLEPAVGRLISLPETGRPVLNDVHLRAGRYIEPYRAGEVLVSEAFANAHRLRPGDSVRAIINGRFQELRIVGVALSPEYVLSIQGGTLLPDEKRFGIFWIGYEELAAAYDMDGAFIDLAVTLMPGASQAEVIRRIDQLTERYGGAGAYGRADQLSHRFLSDEIRGLRGMGMIVPLIFLGVAAFLLNVVMSRLIGTQREQVAALKAFGYSKFEVGWHYLKFVLVIVLIGTLLGTAAGVWLAQALTGLYARFYKFPVLVFSINPMIFALGLATAAGAAVLGTLGAVRRAVVLPAAQAMRPEPPPNFRPTVIERLGFQRLFSQPVRMVLREIERRPIKASLSVLGIAMAVAILVMGQFLTDALDHMLEFGFYVQQRQDVTVAFTEPTSPAAIFDVLSLPGVMQAQPVRAVPVRLINRHLTRRAAIVGIAPDATLQRVVDADMHPVTLPPDGLVMTDILAKLLQLEVGQAVTVEVMEGERRRYRVLLFGTVREYAGVNVYMHIDALNRLMREDRVLTGAYLSVDPAQMPDLYQQIKQTPRIASVAVKEAMVQSFQQTTAENQRTIQVFNMVFACIIAAGVVYNTARISLSERSRELATLRVIGFTRGEISSILLGELAMLTLAALPLGMLLGYGFAWFVSLAVESESYRIPLIISRQTYAMAAVIVSLAALGAGLLVRRRLDRLDLVSVLKSKE